MMRFIALGLLPLAACTSGANHLGNPLLLPVSGIATLAQNAVYNERRARVEVLVKSNHEALLEQIVTGGPLLEAAFDTARVPTSDRPARQIQLAGDIGLYQSSPGALVTALMVYGT